ncbi:MAG: hypothetical protein HQK58_16090 [Deltaproteobacteria bacterium]|nr:hypothetical protein [Deltaproteobacteria bacterium]
MEELAAQGEVQELNVPRWTGKRREFDTYRFVNQVPLRGGEDALLVNWCEIYTRLEDGTVVYHNSFATNHHITEANVAIIVSCGRTRWKSENEGHNVLKKHGYHFDHNYGHGNKYLSATLLTMNMLSFLFHTIQELVDNNYQMIRRKLPRRVTFFDDLRALTRYICFSSWEELLQFMMKGLKLNPNEVT